MAAVAQRLWGAGVSAIDIGGWGGTSWAAVESVRAAECGNTKNHELEALGNEFSDWGIPTIVSLIEVLATGGPVIASGGFRNGIDIAKGMAFGADLCGMALPLLRPAMESDEALQNTIDEVHRQLRAAMFLTGSATLADLRKSQMYITGKTREMIEKDNPARIKQ